MSEPATASAAAAPVLACTGLRKTYDQGGLEVPVLLGIDLSVAASESVAIVGASGSGKSTLLHLLGGLDDASAGEITSGPALFAPEPEMLGAQAEPRRRPFFIWPQAGFSGRTDDQWLCGSVRGSVSLLRLPAFARPRLTR